MEQKDKKPKAQHSKVKPSRLFFWSRWSNSSESLEKKDSLSLSLGSNLE
ncbi:MAG: hypothetical protein AAGL29_01140 [Bacteroidota bacterium]